MYFNSRSNGLCHFSNGLTLADTHTIVIQQLLLLLLLLLLHPSLGRGLDASRTILRRFSPPSTVLIECATVPLVFQFSHVVFGLPLALETGVATSIISFSRQFPFLLRIGLCRSMSSWLPWRMWAKFSQQPPLLSVPIHLSSWHTATSSYSFAMASRAQPRRSFQWLAQRISVVELGTISPRWPGRTLDMSLLACASESRSFVRTN